MGPEPIMDVRDAAIGWHLRLREDATADWESFTAWLEASPAHAAAYDAVSIADAELDPVLAAMPVPPHASNDDRLPRRRWALAGGGLAAALVAAVTVPGLLQDQRYQIVTGPGEQRVVDLAGQGRVALNGATRLTLDRRDPRFAALDSGEATFTIRHDPAHPFQLRIGDDRVEDVGTVFNVVADDSGHRVEVSEGSVIYNPQGVNVPLTAGQTLFDGATASDVIVRSKDPQAIGGWRRGRLDFQAVPLATVAADVSRTLGIPITVAPVIASKPFTGTIAVDRDAAKMRVRLSALLDVEARPAGRGWALDPRTRAPR
ncbi:MAG TPA: FecR domain-containing protein [Sphingomonas sp.]|nr:FecR domain-containing protein [Sphingomonas sp.]